MNPPDHTVLDNAAWHALGGPHAPFAQTLGGARRYRPDVTPFAAVDNLDDTSWDDLTALTGGGVVVLFRDEMPSPAPGWTEVFRGVGHQMVLTDTTALVDAPHAGALGADDVDAMLGLVAATRPGPFLARTIELGGYRGVFHSGRLVAMAGERMHPPGFAEISAVCTHPDVQGRGLAAGLTSLVAADILARGDVPFLHVAYGNDGARRVYERLGFTVRRSVVFVALRPPAR